LSAPIHSPLSGHLIGPSALLDDFLIGRAGIFETKGHVHVAVDAISVLNDIFS
jgi:hypothetical protein